jgi:hypothetical protein
VGFLLSGMCAPFTHSLFFLRLAQKITRTEKYFPAASRQPPRQNMAAFCTKQKHVMTGTFELTIRGRGKALKTQLRRNRQSPLHQHVASNRHH